MKNGIFIFIIVCICLITCNQNPNIQYDETATRGNIKIVVDESFKLLLDTEVFTFCALYKYANIKPIYKSEYDVINDFMNDSVKTIVTSKKLTQSQTDYLVSKSIIPKTSTIAKDAVALIINNKNPNWFIQINKIKQIFGGTITTWKEIDNKNNSGKIEMVFDNNKSANARYFIERLNLKELPKICYAANTNDEVINFVEKNVNAIGIISVNWISENSDSTSNNFLKRIKVVALTSELDPEGVDYYGPFPAYIQNGSYPFVRDVYMITRETFSGLGSGFIQYVSGSEGQRIVLKAGLVPSTMPVRIVQLKKENFK